MIATVKDDNLTDWISELVIEMVNFSDKLFLYFPFLETFDSSAVVLFHGRVLSSSAVRCSMVSAIWSHIKSSDCRSCLFRNEGFSMMFPNGLWSFFLLILEILMVSWMGVHTRRTLTYTEKKELELTEGTSG